MNYTRLVPFDLHRVMNEPGVSVVTKCGYLVTDFRMKVQHARGEFITFSACVHATILDYRMDFDFNGRCITKTNCCDPSHFDLMIKEKTTCPDHPTIVRDGQTYTDYGLSPL